MKINYCEQQTPEWFAEKKAKIGGTRFSNVISGKKNRLVYELLNEQLSEWILQDDYIDDDMQFGIDNEDAALALYTAQTGIKVKKVGIIYSDFSNIHLASPDGLSECETIVQEVKCTQNGAIHMQRYFEGVETSYIPQIKNYFTVSDQIKEVHWISYCPYRIERPLIIIKFERSQFELETIKYRALINGIEIKLNELKEQWIF